MNKFRKMLCMLLVVLTIFAGSALAATRYVTSSVHFRTGAGTKYRSIRVLSAGTKVTTLGKTKKVKTAHKTSTWVKVKYNGKTGWICAGYLTSKKPTAKPTAKPTIAPTAVPTAEPTVAPTTEPTAAPTAEPTAAPAAESPAEPAAEPATEPAA